VLILLAIRSGSNEVGNALGEIAVVLSPILIDCLLDVLALFRCILSAYSHMAGVCRGRTVVEACQADSEPKECRQTILLLEACHVHVVVALHPDFAQRLQPSRRQDLDVLSKLGDIFVFGAVRVAGDKMRYVGREIELDGRAHLRADGRQLGLLEHVSYLRIWKVGSTYALLVRQGGAAQDGARKGQLAGPYALL
jgi:hypothetical protein